MSAIDPPDVETSVNQGAEKIESQRTDNDRKQLEQDDLTQPSRWWFASTACPLLAGTFGPMASGFNICSLVHSWRQSIPLLPNSYEGEGINLKDPSWVIALNAISLVAALTGNAALLLNMTRRLRFSIAQTVTIAGFLLAALLLVADMAALTAMPHYGIDTPTLEPPSRHALTQAFYYAIFASAIYIILSLLMCLTVYGALKGHYKKDFHLTSSQRTLMLQTMSFIAYLLLGALVFSHIEDWEFLNAVYWADVTLLTIGLGDFTPKTRVGRGLLFPFAIGGILIVGLVVGSIRSLILERGKEKLAARVMEKRRSDAVHNVDSNKKTIKIGTFARAEYDPEGLSPAQQREEEFKVMRKVQSAAERERRWLSLSMSSFFALLLWFVGAEVFMQTEYKRNWTYFESLYFSYTTLMTIGYGDYYPESNSGKPFFVFWSLLAIPSLTILISNMGDTVIKWFSDLTNFVGSLTVLPSEGGFRASIQKSLDSSNEWIRKTAKLFNSSDKTDHAHSQPAKRMGKDEYDSKMHQNLAERLAEHADNSGEDTNAGPNEKLDNLETDARFYHYVLARECRKLQKDLFEDPPKQYEWVEWEYYLKLMGNEDDPADFPGQKQPDIMAPEPLRAPAGMVTDGASDEMLNNVNSEHSPAVAAVSGNIPSVDGNIDRKSSVNRQMEAKRKEDRQHRRKPSDSDSEVSSNYLLDWSWLSNASPLMSTKSEAEWILDRLSAALERELNRQRKGFRRRPPISLNDAKKSADDEKKNT